MRTWTIGALLCLCAVCGAGCSAITAREAERRAGGWGPLPRSENVGSGELEREAVTLPEPQRSAVLAALALVGTSDRHFDCSGMVVQAYAAAGVDLPRTVREQLAVGEPILPPDLRPGDLVFFAFAHRAADHVGLYAGRGQIVHVSASTRCVQLAPLSSPVFAAAQVAARRPDLARPPAGSPAT
jgi:cell wall-associated NlpC family hydrolase